MLALVVLGLLADRLAPLIPFSAEQRIARFEGQKAENESPIQAYLQGLARRITMAQPLPEGMALRVHYVDADTVNAFATVGGHIVLFRGLLEKLPHENALAMVMAHEIAHIRHRHPIRNLGRGAVIGIALGLVSGSMGNEVLEHFLGEAGLLTQLTYSRDQEREADATAMHALVTLYGHLAGADELFQTLKEAAGGWEPPEFLSTHPMTDSRLTRIRETAALHSESASSPVTPLPEAYLAWLKQMDPGSEAAAKRTALGQ